MKTIDIMYWIYFDFFYTFLFKFVEQPDLPDKRYFWENFPNEWKIRKDSLSGLSQHSCNAFFPWALSRIQKNEKIDLVLQEVTENLFPTIDIEVWSRILIFAYSSYPSENRVKSIIDRNWSFGFRMANMVASFGEYSFETFPKPVTIDITEKERTFELALLFFSKLFTEENLNKFKTEAESLVYPENSSKDYKKRNC